MILFTPTRRRRRRQGALRQFFLFFYIYFFYPLKSLKAPWRQRQQRGGVKKEKEKKKCLKASWRRCYYPHWSRDSVSPVCGIFHVWLFVALAVCQCVLSCANGSTWSWPHNPILTWSLATLTTIFRTATGLLI